jgi:threonine aldolase
MINLKSDLMNLPTDEMYDAMRRAEIGWVLGGEDPAVNRLKEMGARMMGKEAALFVLTGRMACLIALMTYGNRGNQVILEKNSHIIWAQKLGLSYICGLYPRLIEGRKGLMEPADLEAAIIDSRFKHAPKTDLVCLENTHNMAGGTVLTVKQTNELCDVAHRHGAKVFIDGCRIFYAAAALEVAPKELVSSADMVAFSLIKGLCGPGGALLCGSSEDIERAAINLARIGANSFHRAGMLAAAGIVALETMVDRLREDILRAREFAKAISGIDGLAIDPDSVQSNIVMVDISASGLSTEEFLRRLEKRGVKGHEYTPEIARFTFHRHITDEDAEKAVDVIKKVIEDH